MPTPARATRSRFGWRSPTRVKDAELDVALEVTNTGDEVLPASIGAHPAFNWPLLPGLAKEAYGLTFSDDEPAPIRRLEGGLVLPTPQPTPISGKTVGAVGTAVR